MLAKRWTLCKPLGAGGTGTVYEAVHRNGRRVAVKILHPEFANHSNIRKRFSSEGYAANRVQHADAVAVLDDGEEPDGTAFLVMELLEGRSLAKMLAERGPLSTGEVVAAALATLDVLAAAHDNGVVHRDVKPGNIFATNGGRFKLLDFGVAQVADLASSIVTQTGGAVGTPAFMAPEQAAGRVEEIDALTDIWAVGATMFQLLTGRLVHQVSSNNGTIVAAATTPAPLIRSVAPRVPAKIANVIDRALAFERSARWPNARGMQQALRSACPEIAGDAFTESPGQETIPETKPVVIRHPMRTARQWLGPGLGGLVALPFLIGALVALAFLLPGLSVWATQPPIKPRSVGSAPSATPSSFIASAPTAVVPSQSVSSHALMTPSAPTSTSKKSSVVTASSAPVSSQRAKPASSPDPSDSMLLDKRK